MVTARRRGGAVEPYIHRRWGSRGTVTSSAAGGPLPSRRPRRFIWAATEDRPTRTRRTGTESDARGMPCHPWFAAGDRVPRAEQASRAGLGTVHAFGRSVVVRLHTCIATSCFFFPLLSLLLHFCPLLLLCFFSLSFLYK